MQAEGGELNVWPVFVQHVQRLLMKAAGCLSVSSTRLSCKEPPHPGRLQNWTFDPAVRTSSSVPQTV